MDEIEEFVRKVLEDRGKYQKIDLGELSEKQINQINEHLEINLEDFRRVLDNSGVAHVFKKHGGEKAENLRGQVAVTEEDFSKIIDIVDNPDKVEYIGKNKIGNDMILYEKNYDLILIRYIEGIRENKRKHKKEVYLETFYKKKPSKKNLEG